MRKLIKEADPELVEEWKWAKATSPGTPVWSQNGDICTGETYKSVVKLTFFGSRKAPSLGRRYGPAHEQLGSSSSEGGG